MLAKSLEGGLSDFWDAITAPQAVAALKLTFVASLIVVLLNAVTGTLIAWVLVRDDFRGKGLVNAIIDLPFALPTIVAGLTLLALYGPTSPIDINVAFTQTAIVLCLTRMNKVLSIDLTDRVARVEAGITNTGITEAVGTDEFVLLHHAGDILGKRA